jgi:hypothetical protein
VHDITFALLNVLVSPPLACAAAGEALASVAPGSDVAGGLLQATSANKKINEGQAFLYISKLQFDYDKNEVTSFASPEWDLRFTEHSAKACEEF